MYDQEADVHEERKHAWLAQKDAWSRVVSSKKEDPKPNFNPNPRAEANPRPWLEIAQKTINSLEIALEDDAEQEVRETELLNLKRELESLKIQHMQAIQTIWTFVQPTLVSTLVLTLVLTLTQMVGNWM